MGAYMKLLISLLLFFSSNIIVANEETLIGGRAAKDGEYPEVVYISNGRSKCSATIVGPKVILTAAHCVADNGEIKPAEFVVSQTIYKAKCKQAPQYRDNTEDLDIAICKTDKKMNVAYASISKTGVSIGQEVVLMGYGCIREGGGGGNDGILRVGKAKVTRLPSGSNNWYYTKDTSALCFGDSGGPSMLKDSHTVIGVNSRGNIKDLSMLAAVYLSKAIKFFEEFARDNDVKVCGINKKCEEGGEENPPPPPPPRKEPWLCKHYNKMLKTYKKKVIKYEDKYKKCMDRANPVSFENFGILPYYDYSFSK